MDQCVTEDFSAIDDTDVVIVDSSWHQLSMSSSNWWANWHWFSMASQGISQDDGKVGIAYQCHHHITNGKMDQCVTEDFSAIVGANVMKVNGRKGVNESLDSQC